MNQQGLEKLITAVEQAEVFNMNFDPVCLDGLAEKILGLAWQPSGKSLETLLEIDQQAARNLYWGKDLEGNEMVYFEVAEKREKDGSFPNRPDHREKILNYLKTLRE
jgi:hypothetical protein